MSRREELLQIPRENADLRAYVRKKRIKVWLLTIGWEAFWLLVFGYYHGREDLSFDYRFSLVLAILLLVGLFAFGWVRMLFDRSWRGTITRIDYKQVMMTEVLTRHRRIAQQMCIRVEEENGRTHKIMLEKKRNFDRYYHVGDQITYHGGLLYPESNDGADRNLYVCSLCGGVELSDTDRCHGCGASLIKPERSRYAKEERIL